MGCCLSILVCYFMAHEHYQQEESESMALKNVRRYDANGRELTEKDLETFRLDSPVVREILANLNREVTEGIRQKEKKGDD